MPQNSIRIAISNEIFRLLRPINNFHSLIDHMIQRAADTQKCWVCQLDFPVIFYVVYVTIILIIPALLC